MSLFLWQAVSGVQIVNKILGSIVDILQPNQGLSRSSPAMVATSTTGPVRRWPAPRSEVSRRLAGSFEVCALAVKIFLNLPGEFCGRPDATHLAEAKWFSTYDCTRPSGRRPITARQANPTLSVEFQHTWLQAVLIAPVRSSLATWP